MSTRRPAITSRANLPNYPSAVSIESFKLSNDVFICETDARQIYKNTKDRWYKFDGKEFTSMRLETVPQDVIDENAYRRKVGKNVSDKNLSHKNFFRG